MFDSTEEPLALKTADLAGLIEQNHAELVSAEMPDATAGLRLG